MKAAAFFVCLSLAAAQDIPAPTKTPAKTRPEDVATLRSAVELHDRGEYDSAIAKYKQVLSQNPDDITALYELTFSYFAAKKYQDCIDAAKIGVQYNAPVRGRFYSNMGSCLDESGRTDEALKLYRAAIAALPGDFMLPFNLGITLTR